MTGTQGDFERGDTAPLNAVQNSHGHGSAPGTSAPPGSQERTRPTFPPPPQVRNTGVPGNGPPEAHRRPGNPHSGPPASPAGPVPVGNPTSRAPTAAPSGPPRTPAGARGDDRSGPRGRITPAGWVVRGLVLFAVSVTSGLLWLAVKPQPSEPQSERTNVAEQPKGLYRFDPQIREEIQSCRNFSTGRIAEYFAQNPCEHLTRALYTTTLDNGERVLTSVVTALMPSKASAAQLEKLTTRSGTGNIEDLVSAGRTVPDDYPELDGDYGYASQQQGALVVIGESSYFTASGRDDARLKKVTADALRLGWPQDKGPR